MIRRRLAAALPVAALAAALACRSPQGKLDAANAARLAGKPAAALAAYKEVLAELGEGSLSGGRARMRWDALKGAADVSYLELGDYGGAIAYYRRIISLYPGRPEAYEARALIGNIYRDRLRDPLGAIAQYADIAGSDTPQAPRYQLEVAKQYLELKNYEQARIEARILRERWPDSELADEAQLLTAQAWSLEKRDEAALGAFEALVKRHPRQDVVARAREGEGLIYAEEGKFDRALEMYALALDGHPNPDAIRTAIDAVRERRERAKTSRPGDRAAAFDVGKWTPSPREHP